MARTILLDQLTGRARSRKELADKLASRQVPEEIATQLLDRFEEVGLVDDWRWTGPTERFDEIAERLGSPDLAARCRRAAAGRGRSPAG